MKVWQEYLECTTDACGNDWVNSKAEALVHERHARVLFRNQIIYTQIIGNYKKLKLVVTNVENIFHTKNVPIWIHSNVLIWRTQCPLSLKRLINNMGHASVHGTKAYASIDAKIICVMLLWQFEIKTPNEWHELPWLPNHPYFLRNLYWHSITLLPFDPLNHSIWISY